MKILAVADAFMKKEYYENCFRKYPELDPTIIFWGDPEREDMRSKVHLMERNGPYTLEPPAELEDIIEDFELLMVHLCPLPEKVLAKAKKLRAILSNRGGLENIDVATATKYSIPVLNNPAHNANSVAELTIGLMLAETRNIARTHANMVKGIWEEYYANAGKVYELCGRTVGIIGFGNIGRRVARRLTAFDTRTLVYDSWVSPDDPDIEKCGCEYVPLEELLKESDIVTLHIRSHERYLSAEQLRMLKRGAYFINTARSHLIDNDEMYRLLRSGHLMGAAFDVYESEPLPADADYLKLPNVTFTNHRGGDTVNCYSDSPEMLIVEYKKLASGNRPKFFVNKTDLGL